MIVGSKEIEIGRERRRMEVPSEVFAGIARSGGYRSVLSSIPDARALSNRAKVHRAMAEGIRLRMLWALSRSELCPCLLKDITGLSDSKLSYHLKILRDAGLVRVARRRSWRVYSITPEGRAEVARSIRRRKG